MRLSVAAIALLVLACKTAGPPAVFAADPCAAPDVASQASQAQGLADQQKFAEAETPARSALAQCPSQPVAAAVLGRSLVAQKKYDEAVQQMSAVIAAKPDVAYAYMWRGYAHYHKKQPDRMVGDFETFLKLAPNSPDAATVKQILTSVK